MKYIILLIAELIFINSLHSQTLIEDFNMPTPYANPEIWTINIDINDKILISGNIDFYEDTKVPNFIRLNSDGSLDESFHFNSIIKPSVVDFLSTGEIIALNGDSIYKVDDSGAIIKTIQSSFNRMTIIQDYIFLASYDSLIKLNSDLEIDESFNRGNKFSGFITNIANQGNEKLLVAGIFNQVNGLDKNSLARFDLDGNLDLSFDAGSGTSDYIGGLVIQPDNKIILSESNIYSFNGITCDGIVRLNEDGSLDMEFTTPIYYSFDVTFQNGKILVSAYYDDGLTHEKRILRLKPDGTMDNGFNIIDADASEIALFSNGKILANTINNLNGITRYSENGILDEEFSPPLERIGGFDNAAFYGDFIIVTGNFFRLDDLETTQIGKLNLDGSLDLNFKVSDNVNTGSTSNNRPREVKVKSENEIFISLGNKLLKLDSKGNPVDGFSCIEEVEVPDHYPDSYFVEAFEFLSNDQIVVRGPNGAYLLNEDGTQDLSFIIKHNINSTALGLDLQSDEKILIGGAFTEVNGQEANYLARFNIDGTLDDSFNSALGASFSPFVDKIQVLSNDEIIVNSWIWYGSFNNLDLIKLGKDGDLDETFNNHIISAFPERTHLIDGDDHINESYLFSYSDYSECEVGKLDYSGKVDSNFGIVNKYNIVVEDKFSVKPIGSGSKHFLVLGEFILENGENTNGLLFSDNISPVIKGTVSTLSTSEENPFLITLDDLIIEDPDNEFPDDFSLTVMDGENYTVIENQVIPAEDFNGLLTILVTVNDGVDDSQPFELTLDVTAVNDIPVITGTTTSLTTPEDAPLSISIDDLTVEDPDNEFPADYLLTVLDGENYSVADNQVTPATDFNGPLTVPVKVNDGVDDSQPFELTLDVTAVNDIPVITGTATSLTIPEDTPYAISIDLLTIDDPDNEFPDDFAVTILNGENYTVSENQVVPAEEFNGSLTIPITVNDGEDDSQSFQITLDVTAVNDIPVITGTTTSLTTMEETPIVISIDNLTVEDPDNEFPGDFSLTVLDGENYSVIENQVIPVADFNGLLTVPVTVNDGVDDSQPFQLSVEVTMILGLSNISPELSIYPNPATWQITINGLSEVNTDDVIIYNLEGVVMNQRKNIEGDKITIDLSSLIDGTYILIINSDESSFAKRIVKY